MQIQITGKHIQVTDPIKEFIHSKFSKLDRHFDHITQAHIIISIEKERHISEATVGVSGKNLFAKSESTDMYSAIDMLIDKLDAQLIKYKEKLKNHHGPKDKNLFAEDDQEES